MFLKGFKGTMPRICAGIFFGVFFKVCFFAHSFFVYRKMPKNTHGRALQGAAREDGGLACWLIYVDVRCMAQRGRMAG